MSLLKLTPDSTRLRQVAKAHAAGEVSKREFRELRALVINGFGEAEVLASGDATQRRWIPHDNTTQPFTPAGQLGVATTARALPLRAIAMFLLVLVLALAGAATAYGLPPEDTALVHEKGQQASVPAIELRRQLRPVSERWPFGVPAGGHPESSRDPAAPEDTEHLVGFRTRA